MLLTFIYEGRVEVSQDQLDDFLTAAEELKIEGLTSNISKDKTEEIESHEQKEELQREIKNEICMDTIDPTLQNVTSVDNTEASEKKDDVEKQSKVKKPPKSEDNIKQASKIYCYEKIPIQDLTQIKTIIEEMSEKVGNVWRCKFCGKTTENRQRNTLGLHIETHFEGLSYKCSHCDKSCKNRGALRGHMHRYHQAVPEPNLQPTLLSSILNI